MPHDPKTREAEPARKNSAGRLAALRRGADTGTRTQLAAGLVFGVLVVAFIIVFSLRAFKSHALAAETTRAAAAPAEVDVATVKPAAATQALTLPGETAAWYEATIYARVDGYVSRWFVDIGDHVKAGQVLAVIDTPDLDAQLAAAQAKLGTAEAEVNVREAQADFARTTYVRWRESPKGVVSEQETADKKADYESAKAALVAAQADVKEAQGEVGKYMAFEQYRKVTAPFAGVITQRHVDIGNLVTAGSTAPTTMLYRMSQNNPIRVFVDVPQAAAPEMTVGSPVDVSVGGTGRRTFSGRITRTSDAVDPQSRTMKVEADIPNQDGALVPGLYIDATFHLRAEGAAEVPAAAIMLRPEGT
ncbi:MAG TPA: efflux RND transporter periplasmic adaptor subunit, partial [Opitutaceae bacterium]|nr:efflux RND transporter periplasmic adaptor subunit [Opitutaceae bacterium]